MQPIGGSEGDQAAHYLEGDGVGPRSRHEKCTPQLKPARESSVDEWRTVELVGT